MFISVQLLEKMLVLLILVLVGAATSTPAHPPDEKTINQAIQEAAVTSKSMDFLQTNDTLMVGLDMLMSADDWFDLQNQKNGKSKRKGIRRGRWTNRVVTYEGIPFAHREIQAAIDDYHKYTCIQFRNGRARNTIYFTDGGGCSSYVGMLGIGRQPVTLANGCRQKGIIIHELGHAVGLQHEQTRNDRDQFVQINFNNIHDNMAFNFQRNEVDNQGVGYSYTSIMHYDERAFSKNGGITIQARDSRMQNKMGNRKGFDFADIKILNLMYKCGDHCGGKRCPSEGFLDKDCQCLCPGNPVRHCGSYDTGSSGGGGGVGGGEPTTGGNSCYNEHQPEHECEDWKKSGNCHDKKYKYWMSINCQKTCGLCSGKNQFSSPTACEDQLEHCETWAAKGECKSNPSYMNDSCPKSCGTCNKTKREAPECTDVNPACAAWAEKGMCETEKEYMRETCGRSCNKDCR